jgi:hypothetical protein
MGAIVVIYILLYEPCQLEKKKLLFLRQGKGWCAEQRAKQKVEGEDKEKTGFSRYPQRSATLALQCQSQNSS